MIRVYLVDDQTLVRQGIRNLLEIADDIEVVGEAADAAGALAALRAMRPLPDVLLLDVRMPEASGIDLMGELAAKSCLPPTIILTTFDDDEALLSAVKAGARGFLLKDASLDTLLSAIRTVAAGGTLVKPGVTERVVRGLTELRELDAGAGPGARKPAAGGAGASPDLTPRELEILRLLAGGYSNKEIAGALGVAEGTVKNHVSSLLAKIGCRDRTRAVLRGVQEGWI